MDPEMDAMLARLDAAWDACLTVVPMTFTEKVEPHGKVEIFGMVGCVCGRGWPHK